METLPGLILYFARVGVLAEQEMPVVVEVSDDGRGPTLLCEAFNDVGNGLRGIVVVDGDAHHLGTGASECGDLLDRAFDVCGVGVGH